MSHLRRFGLLGALLLLALGCDDGSSSGGSTDLPDGGLRDGGGETSDGQAGEPGGGGGDDTCEDGDTRCVGDRLAVCVVDGDEAIWLAEDCGEAEVCRDGACVEDACEPGERRCTESGVLVCLADGSDWAEPVACPEDTSCVRGVCLEQDCTPGETACGDKELLTCAEDGLTWDRTACAAGESCIDGACTDAPPSGGIPDCVEGEALCAPDGILTCDDDGASQVEPCPEGEACFRGECVGCVADANCPEGEVCVEGACVPPPLRIVNEALPDGQLMAEYFAALEAENGAPPYVWALADGELPAGLELEPERAAIAGTPDASGDFPITVEVTDDAGATASRDLLLRVFRDGLVITTDSPLPEATEGEGYEVTLEALGGQAPIGWFIIEGALPAGVELAANGVLRGTPSEIGTFEFTVRAVDAGTPPVFDEKAFAFDVVVAPLRIVGEQSIDLFFTQIITLPLITVIRDIPIPYDTQLEARGGLRPYTWSEVPIEGPLADFIPNAGIPDGLVLEEDGRLRGAVVDPDLVVSLTIPFTQITLSGFFFTAEVRDSQGVPDSDSAIFLMPTVPIGN